MVSLTDLPLELRWRILDLAIHAERSPPKEWFDDAPRVLMTKTRKVYGEMFGRQVYVEADQNLYRANASRLGAVNHQFYREVKLLVRDILVVVYKLDLAVMQGKVLWPTWTSIPVCRSTVDVLEVTIRSAGPGVPCVNSVWKRRQGQSRYMWWFYSVLEHFFTVGVGPRDTGEAVPGGDISRRQVMAVKVLDLDFVDPLVPYQEYSDGRTGGDVDGGAASHGGRVPRCSHCRVRCHGQVPAEHRNYCAKSLYLQIVDMVFLLLRPILLRFGGILYQGVETIRFRLNGDLKYEVVISELLRRRPMVDDMYAARERFGLENGERVEPGEDIFDERVIMAARADALAAVQGNDQG